MCVQGATLVDEPWIRESYPVPTVRALPPVVGYWGARISKRPETAQRQLNELLKKVQLGLSQIANPRVFIEPGSLVKAHIDDQVGTIVEVTGRVPTFSAPQAFGPETYQQIDRLQEMAHQSVGVSQMAAAGMKPAGINSGRALRIYREMQNRRFAGFEADLEQCVCELARQIVYLEQDVAEEYPDHEVVYEVFGTAERIPWAELNLEPDRLRLRIAPTSGLAASPAARMQDLEELVEGGVLDQAQFLRLANDPDFESIRKEVTAAEDRLRYAFTQILDGQDYEPPEPYMDLKRGVLLAAQWIQMAEISRVPEERIQVLRQWMTEAHTMMQPPAPPAGAELPMPPGGMMPPEGMLPPMPPEGAPDMPGGPGGLPPDLQPMPPGGALPGVPSI